MSEPTNYKELMTLIRRISGQANFISAPRIYIDMLDGDLVAAVWLNQVVYWDGKTSNPIGFYKTYAEWKKELGLSPAQVRRVAKDCQARGLVNIIFHKVYGTPKNHYLVVWPELLLALKNTVNSDSEESERSESERSESERSEHHVSSPSMEHHETELSLSINSITTDIYISMLEKKFASTDWWRNLEREISHGYMSIDGGAMIISGLGNRAEVLIDRYGQSIESILVASDDLRAVIFME